jgi:hypothetical protein
MALFRCGGFGSPRAAAGQMAATQALIRPRFPFAPLQPTARSRRRECVFMAVNDD